MLKVNGGLKIAKLKVPVLEPWPNVLKRVFWELHLDIFDFIGGAGTQMETKRRIVGPFCRGPRKKATLLNAQTGQCIPLDDPTWVPEVASSHLLVGTITTIASHVDCALGRAWRMPMFHPQLMAATAMLEKLQKYFNALNEAVLGKRLGTAPFSMIAGHLAPELRTIPTREQMPGLQCEGQVVFLVFNQRRLQPW